MRFSLLLLPVLSLAPLTAPLSADDEWMPVGQNASVHKNGNTVSLDYQVARGQLGIAMMQTPGGKPGMTHLRFRVKTDVSTMVGVMLSEKKPGGDYTAFFWSPKDQWQQVDLTPADFSLNDGPKDPEDPNGRLDVDQVQAIGLFDGGQFFSQASDDPNSRIVANPLSGDHKLLWEDFRFLTEDAKAQNQGTVIDDFHRGFLTWFTPGGAELALSKSDNPLKKPALEFRYEQAPYKFTVVLHALGQVNLSGAKELSFDVASERDAHIILSLEGQKSDGRAPRYNHDFSISAGQTGHMSIPFSEFALAEDSPPDPDGHLEVGHLRSIGLIDIIGTLEGTKEKNTLWLADLRVKMNANESKALRDQLVELLASGHAHADFEAAVRDLPPELRGKKPRGVEHTAWQLLEHLRLAQWDILEFSRNPKHVSPKWPDGYWPATPAPPDDAAWDKSIRRFKADRKAMQKLAADPASDLFTPLPHGEGQTLLREALLLADHNAYHIGQLVMLRRLLGAW